MDRVDGAGRQNRLLAALPVEEYQRLLPSLSRVQVVTGQVLIEPRDKMEYAYFPLDGELCLLMLIEDGTVIEVATVGNEGFVDVTALLSVDTSPYEVLCQADCRALRISVEALRAAFRDSVVLRDHLLRFAGVVLGCSGRSAACKVIHTPAQRLARWILMTQDRVAADEVLLTHDLLGRMLGVRRATVSVAAEALQERGLIRYQRGRITITDRAGLKAATCEDHAAFHNEYERLLAPRAVGC